MSEVEKADKVESLLLEHMKRFQGSLDRVERKLDEQARRLSNLESGMASVIQHLGHLSLRTPISS